VAGEWRRGPGASNVVAAVDDLLHVIALLVILTLATAE
jgi:hypothetical protein